MAKITNKRNLAILLDNKGVVEISKIGKGLSKVVERWLRCGDIKKQGETIVGNF